MKYLRLFDNEQNYSNDIGDNVRIDVPNVSLVLNGESVFFNADTVREAYFNVTDESNMTLINDYRTFSEIYLNGGTKNLVPKLVEGSFTIDANDLEQVDEITWHNKSPKKFNATYTNSFVVSCNEEILDDYYVGFSMLAGGSSGGILLHDITVFGTLNELFGTPTNKENSRVNSNTIDLTFFFTELISFVSHLNVVIFKPNENGELIPLTTKNSYVANLNEEKTYDISETQFLEDFFLLDFTLKCEQDILPTDILFGYENNEIVPYCTIEEFLAEFKDELCVDLIDSKTIGTTHGYCPMFSYFMLFGIMRGEVILTQEVNIVGINGFELGNYSLSTDKLGENKIEFKITNRFQTPMFYQSNNLTRLNNKALKYNKNIAPQAFAYCNSLTSLNIPNSVTTIGEYAFYFCESLTSLNIPNSVTSIGDNAFYFCTNLRSANIPNRITTIEFGTFSNCVNLTGITIPDSVTSIESHAFANCHKLDKFIIPKNVQNIENGVFYGCKFQRDKFINQTDLTDNGNWGARLYDTIQSDGLCIDENIAQTCHNWATNVVIPSYVTDISSSAFMGCINLKTVSIPNSVVSIGNYAFDECSNLIEITIPDSVTSIGHEAFSRCTNLTSVNIPDSVTTIGNYAFSSCDSLTSVTIPDSVTTIGNGAFRGCSSLTSVTIPDSVTTIGNGAFSSCDNLASITIGSGVTTIGENLCTVCNQLEYITVAELNQKYDSRNNCNGIIETATNTLVVGCKNTIIPNGVTKIGKYAFFGSEINTFVIPEGVTNIGQSAFEDCNSLKSITMPTTLKRIETDCFYDCKYLKTITCLAKTAPSLGTDSLDVDARNGVLRVPTGSNYSTWLNALPSGWTIEYI